MANHIFLKIYPTSKTGDYFKGNSKAADHPQEIEVDSWSHSFEQPISAATPSSEVGPTSRCNHEPLTFSKFFDNASDDLMKACWIGECLDAVFTLYRPLGASGKNQAVESNRYLAIHVKHAYLKSMSISGEADEVAKEELSLVYNYIQYQFTKVDLKLGKLDPSDRPKIDWYWAENLVGTGDDIPKPSM
ncbi:MAG: type VI secretion system tube protein Hcp [Pseudomonadota bacterium]